MDRSTLKVWNGYQNIRKLARQYNADTVDEVVMKSGIGGKNPFDGLSEQLTNRVKFLCEKLGV